MTNTDSGHPEITWGLFFNPTAATDLKWSVHHSDSHRGAADIQNGFLFSSDRQTAWLDVFEVACVAQQASI